jgi:hypothetical protein
MAPTDPKPYTTYRSGGDGGTPRGGPYRPYSGGRRVRRRRRRSRGPLMLLVVVLVLLALAGAAVAVFHPFSKATAAGAATGSGESGQNIPAALASSRTPTPSPTPTKTATPAPSPKVATVTGGGDVIGGFGVSGVVDSLGAGLFKSIARYFESSDYGFVNLESPLTYGGTPQSWKDVVIKGNPKLAKAMSQSGINVVTMANNHAGDMGDSGLLDSFRYCRQAGITVVGAGRTLKEAQAGTVLTRNGTKTAFLGFTDVLPAGYPATASSPGTSPGRANINAVRTNIRSAAAKADYVVVGWHWNFEYKRAPSYLESSEGKAAVDAGADIVFAHHPHLLDGVQAYHGGLIFYSLGNLVFSGFSGETAQTVLVKARISKHAIDAKLIPVTISGSGIPTVAGGSTGLAILQRVKSFSSALGTTVTIADGRGYVHVKR